MSDSEGEIHLTQQVTTVDHEIYDCLKQKLGSLDRQTFESQLLEIYKNNEDELKNVRSSVYDYARHACPDMPEGSLSNRVQRSNGRSVVQKYAADIYLLYSYIEGSVSSQTLLSEVMSSHRRRVDRLNSTLNETYVGESISNESSVIDRDTLKHLIEMKQLIQSNSTLVTDHFVKFEKRQDGEIKTLKQQLKLKDTELSKLREELDSCRNRETDLKAQNKILRQEVSILKIEMDQQSYLIKNQKDIESKYHGLETKLQSIINKLKVLDIQKEKHSGESIERSDNTVANKNAHNVHVDHQDWLVDNTEFIDRDTSVDDENDSTNRGLDIEPEIDEPEYNQPLYSDVARSKKGASVSS